MAGEQPLAERFDGGAELGDIALVDDDLEERDELVAAVPAEHPHGGRVAESDPEGAGGRCAPGDRQRWGPRRVRVGLVGVLGVGQGEQDLLDAAQLVVELTVGVRESIVESRIVPPRFTIDLTWGV